MLSKPTDEAHSFFTSALDKPRKKIIRVSKDPKISKKDLSVPKPINLSEMVTLQIIKSSHETGVVKKMIHAPTLKLYAVKVAFSSYKNI